MNSPVGVFVMEGARLYLDSIPGEERGAIRRDIEALASEDAGSVYTRQLRGKIRELKSGPHRLTYFILDRTLYIVRGFRKKSARTPKREIDYAEKMYVLLKSS